MKSQRVMTAVALGGALWLASAVVTWQPAGVIGEAMPLDSRVSQIEERIDILEKDVDNLRDKVTASTQVSAAALPGACMAVRTTPETWRSVNGGMSVTTEGNYNGVEGLNRIEVNEGGTVTVTYSVPDWLSQAYGGNVTAIVREAENGRLQNQRARTNCRP